ncbi:hypothetical protein CE756_14750 [Salmonella enterica]|nr:hypothetical protein [Salmonella enterica subsp. enterica serovar Braenderup]EAZ7357976.1 hypothetical protein [Salmonella enterica]QEP62454.1 hypothetical protein D9I79_17825 [Escherichia coli]EDA8504612.1 hypothetical protein [Salmonella enterica subsp. enterica serovar Braenderup]EDH5844962.1 hypothetical protein [Salmonella enterica subsp. enterica serovar Braenderup]
MAEKYAWWGWGWGWGWESVKEKKAAAPFVVTFIFIDYASRNTRWDKTETHKASQWLARLYMF